MRRGQGLLIAAVVGGAGALWAARQPGGISGTCRRLQQGVRDVQAGQDPAAVCKRFLAGTDEEPAGNYANEAVAMDLTGFQEPYRDQLSS